METGYGPTTSGHSPIIRTTRAPGLNHAGRWLRTASDTPHRRDPFERRTMGLIAAIISGLIVGALARWFYPGRQDMSLLKTILLGIAGGFVAGILGRTVGIYSPGEGAGLIASALGAMLLIWAFGKIQRDA